jgi:hypothetical protein
VQYEEDSEWLVYPIQKEGVEIELDLYPEDVVMSANGTLPIPGQTPAEDGIHVL